MIRLQNKSIAILMTTLLILLLSSAGTWSSAPADYPSRPVTIVCPFAAGGGSDVFLRILQPFLSEELGTVVQIVNREGAGSQVGVTYGLMQPDDGYTVVQFNQPHLSNTILYQRAPYDIDDIAVVNIHHIDPECLSVRKDAPYKDLSDFIEAIRENPGTISVGVNQGSGQHAMANWLQDVLDLDFIIVPYPGGAPARTAVMGGHIDAVLSTVGAVYQDEDLRGLAVGGLREFPEHFPGVRTIIDQLEAYGFAPEEVPVFGASYRGIGFKASFKEKYPDRWQFFLDAYERAFNHPEHMKRAAQAGLLPIMNLLGPEESQRLSEQFHITLERYGQYFR